MESVTLSVLVSVCLNVATEEGCHTVEIANDMCEQISLAWA